MTAGTRTDTQTGTLEDWIILHRTPGIGASVFHQLLDRFGSARNILQAGAGELVELGLSRDAIETLKSPNEARIAADLDWLAEPGNHLVTCKDSAYPALLKQTGNPPPLLYVHGNPGVLAEPQLAIVGSRNPSPQGVQAAREFAQHLASAGLVITSGLALGIDTASHQGALDVGMPTIAVTGTGLDRVYPASNRELAHAIAVDGALVSEFPIGTSPRPENFPQRNRIISGLSLGTLVVEAAKRSGSLITARFAGEQGREVFAIPGSIHNPLARGCHHLIRQGAKLVETAQDIIDELLPLAGSLPLEPGQPLAADAVDNTPQLDEDYSQLLEIMGFEPVSINQLVENSRLTPAEVSSMLLQLEMSGYVAASHGGTYNRLK